MVSIDRLLPFNSSQMPSLSDGSSLDNPGPTHLLVCVVNQPSNCDNISPSNNQSDINDQIRQNSLIVLRSENNESSSDTHNTNCKSSFMWWLSGRPKCRSLDNSEVSRSNRICINLTQYQELNQEREKMLSENETTNQSSVSDLTALPGPSGLNFHQTNNENDSENDEDIEYSSDFRKRSHSLTPTARFAIQAPKHDIDVDLGTIEPVDEGPVPEEQLTITSNGSKTSHKSLCLGDNRKIWSDGIVTNHGHTVSCRPISESSSLTQVSIGSSVYDPNAPMCKICHLNGKEMDPLITPCRCAGTMKYIHCGCLMRWLEISSKRTRKPLNCELCQYQYQWYKKFKVRHWQFPHCSRKDKILHSLFFLSVGIMIACAVMTILCFKHERGQKLDPNRTELTQSEIVTLICGVLFFLAFFMAMYVEVKARNTLYKLMLKFIYLNQQWYIDEYEKKDQRPVDI